MKFLIIGGSGSLGHALSACYHDQQVCIFSRNENKQWQMKKKFPQHTYFTGDVCQKNDVERCILQFQPQFIIVAAALKHVDVCENFIDQSNRINIGGITTVLEWVYTHQQSVPFLKTILFVSTDKAVEPITVYGMGKSIAERKVLEMSRRLSRIKCLITRYGNVVFSSGSILPIYQEIATNPNRKTFPVTHSDMTRFYMTLDESVELIDVALNMGKTGEIWIPKLPSFRILDVAQLFSKKYNKPIEIIGIRGIEKVHEKLIATHELANTLDSHQDYYIISPESQKGLTQEYTSNQEKFMDMSQFLEI